MAKPKWACLEDSSEDGAYSHVTGDEIYSWRGVCYICGARAADCKFRAKCGSSSSYPNARLTNVAREGDPRAKWQIEGSTREQVLAFYEAWKAQA